ncbi:MAG: DUF6252 family protein [Flavobacteriales bacterium]
MKNLTFVLNALIISAILFSSCKKKDSEEVIIDTGGITITPVESITADIGGNPFQASTIIHQLLDETTHVFIATSISGDILTIRVEDLSPGTYDIDFDIPTITLFTGGYLYDQSPSATGNIVISTNADNRISGTFETAVNNIAETGQTIEVTGGIFTDVSY